MAWAEAHKLGCAVQKCDFGTYVVCNYDKGNMLEKDIYEQGPTCSRCPAGYECKDSLCSVICNKGGAGKR